MIQRIRQYLNKRMITDDIIRKFRLDDGIYYGKFWITIPIYDADGHKVFTKLRKDPIDKLNLSKYKYFPYGVKPVLYGAHNLDTTKESIYVCEGEFDTLVLQSHGLNAVSSTSGSGTFKDEWIDTLCKYNKVYLTFDNDKAGQDGAYKVYEGLTKKTFHGTIYNIELPVKDITDYFMDGGTVETSLSLAKKVDKMNLLQGESELIIHDTIQVLMHNMKNLIHPFAQKLCDELLSEARRKLRKIRRDRLYKEKEFPGDIDIMKIKSDISISDICDAKIQNKTPRSNNYLCPIHNEDTPSFHWYKDTNSFYCFGCHQGGSVIDLYMKINNCDFKEAINNLSKLL